MEGFLVCSACGQSFAEFQKSGLFGCASCYEAFQPELDRLFKRIQGVCSHNAEAPTHAVDEVIDLEALEAKLRDAVSREDFEEAVVLRDQIRRLKQPESTNADDL